MHETIYIFFSNICFYLYAVKINRLYLDLCVNGLIGSLDAIHRGKTNVCFFFVHSVAIQPELVGKPESIFFY